MSKPIETSPELLALLEKVKSHKMTPAEVAAQRKSWVKGEMLLENEGMTEEQFEKLWADIHGEQL